MKGLAARSGDLALELTSAFDTGSIALAAGDGPSAAASLEEALARDGGRVPRALARLRLAKDKAEFDQFMAERRTRTAPSSPPPT